MSFRNIMWLQIIIYSRLSYIHIRPLCKHSLVRLRALKVHAAILAKLSFYGCHVVLYATDRVTHKHNGLIYMAVLVNFSLHFYHNLKFFIVKARLCDNCEKQIIDDTCTAGISNRIYLWLQLTLASLAVKKHPVLVGHGKSF